MDFGKLRKAMWDSHGVCLLSHFNVSYVPLQVLKISKWKSGEPAELEVWKDGGLAKLCKGLKDEDKPTVQLRAPLQEMSDSFKRAGIEDTQFHAFIEAHYGVDSNKTGKYELEFYSTGVHIGDLQNTLAKYYPTDQWDLLTQHSYPGILGTPRCGVVQEVWYARHVEIQVDEKTQKEVRVVVPVERIADAVKVLVPVSAPVVAPLTRLVGNIKLKQLTKMEEMQKMVRDADGFFPIAIRFVRVVKRSLLAAKVPGYANIMRVDGRRPKVSPIPRMKPPRVNKPQGGDKKPQGGVKKPQGGDKKPQGGVKKPQGGDKKPQGGVKKPQGGVKKPQGGVKKPQGGVKKPQGGVKNSRSRAAAR